MENDKDMKEKLGETEEYCFMVGCKLLILTGLFPFFFIPYLLVIIRCLHFRII
jgi:hypothetical protein